jgi:DNA-binding NarL/FixJ family response regulator
MIHVCIADDHDLIRDGFANLLDGEEDIAMIGEAASASELFQLLREEACEVVVLDIGLPDKNGLEVLKELKAEFPQVKILILTMHPEERYAVRAIRNGASGYVSKIAASEELLDAIRKVYRGSHYISEDLAEQLAVSFQENYQGEPHEQLSDREFEIMLLIGAGKSGPEIAEELGLSVNTIHTYRRRILEKMRMSSSAEIIAYVLRHKLIE